MSKQMTKQMHMDAFEASLFRPLGDDVRHVFVAHGTPLRKPERIQVRPRARSTTTLDIAVEGARGLDIQAPKPPTTTLATQNVDRTPGQINVGEAKFGTFSSAHASGEQHPQDRAVTQSIEGLIRHHGRQQRMHLLVAQDEHHRLIRFGWLQAAHGARVQQFVIDAPGEEGTDIAKVRTGRIGFLGCQELLHKALAVFLCDSVEASGTVLGGAVRREEGPKRFDARQICGARRPPSILGLESEHPAIHEIIIEHGRKGDQCLPNHGRVLPIDAQLLAKSSIWVERRIQEASNEGRMVLGWRLFFWWSDMAHILRLLTHSLYTPHGNLRSFACPCKLVNSATIGHISLSLEGVRGSSIAHCTRCLW